MPMRLGRALLLALVGGVATFVSCAILAVAFWMPYWHQLRRNGMYVHDFGAEQLVIFGPIIVTPIFFPARFTLSAIRTEASRVSAIGFSERICRS